MRHVISALVMNEPGVLANVAGMFAHTFRGTTWRSVLGLEPERAAFARYCEIRKRERNYVDWPDSFPQASIDSNYRDGSGDEVRLVS